MKIYYREPKLETKKNKTYQILGSAETNPVSGVISHNSPLGAALLGKQVREVINLEVNNKTINYKIININ
ncbi:MAG: GreA/GreB family elongation factor [Patescibacteria group bacterium]